MKKMIVALVASTLGLSTAAIAQDTPPAPQQNTITIGGTTMTTTTAAGIGLGVLGLGLILSDDSDGTTTTPGT